MPVPPPDPNEIDLVELQLQQELRAMFEVDSQKYLQDYLSLVQQLSPQSWMKDIQELYRAIHTIKGSAVTVGADAILWVATALEDMLSDLRHLDPAPPLEDGQLRQMLLESGELLASSLEVRSTGAEAAHAVELSVQYIQSLREQAKQRYLPEWNEQSLLHQEFAEQGFGLVVLDLEMALEQMPQQGEVAGETIEIARQTLAQLTEIGKDLQMAGGWTQLLEQCEELCKRPSTEIWRSQWMGYLNALKSSAKEGGKYVEPERVVLPESEATTASFGDSEFLELSASELSLLDFEEVSASAPSTGESLSWEQPSEPIFAADEFAELSEAADQLAQFDWEQPTDELAKLNEAAEQLAQVDWEQPAEPVFTTDEFVELSEAADQLAQLDWEQSTEPVFTTDEFVELSEAADQLAQLDWEQSTDEFAELNEAAEQLAQIDLETPAETAAIEEDWSGLVATPSQPDVPQTVAVERLEPPSQPDVAPTVAVERLEPQSIVATTRIEEFNNDVQIPVPLNRLDSTARNLVDTLLTARASQGFYQNLQTQLTQLFALANESTQYITRLRQLQNDYALLDNLRSSSNTDEGLTLESYRQGYTTINRLLETSLRLSELGAEAQKTAMLTADSLQSLEQNILRLRQTVEQSRLVPFKNLAFRARAIVRDLTTRFDKPARLIVEGEQIELDAATSSKLETVLLHLIRNAYDHGLESPSDRAVRDKPEQGTISVSLKRKGNAYLLDVGDDGRGIDPEAIARSARTKGLPLTNTRTPAELLAVICQPGFSSKTTVSEISGRGVGMDVVANRLAGLGGRMSLDTQVGSGSRFRLQFPVPHLLVPCVLVQAGDRTFAIPSQDITTTTILSNLNATPIVGSNNVCTWKIWQGDEILFGLDLLGYWQSQSVGRSLDDTAVCMYVRPADDRSQGIWVLADEVLGQTELLISPMPSPLIAPIGLLGISLQPNGSLVPVVETAALAEVLLSSPGRVSQSLPMRMVAESQAIATEPREGLSQLTQTILVVDDAALMRRRIEASLTACGYSVSTCADGQEAWNWLQTNPVPAMTITDIEMPNMDGFTLIDRMRKAGITIPIMVVSSRLAAEWSKEARRLGANDYLTKGFSTAELLDKVKTLLSGDRV